MISSVRKTILLEWLELLLGLTIFAFGIHLTILANIGLGPWDCFGMGLSYHTPLNYGLAMTASSIVILCIDLLMKEHIGFGTVFDALLTNNIANFFLEHGPIPYAQSAVGGIAMMLCGITFMCLGQFFYMRAGHGCGPRDSLMVALGKRLPKVPIGAVLAAIYVVVLAIGWALGGAVGLGTLISTGCSGIIMQGVCRLLHFEPRDVVHRDILTIARQLYSGQVA